MQLYSVTHCLQNSLRKRYAWKLENSFIKEKAKDHVLRSKQIRSVNHKIYLVKKQDHLGKHNAKCEAFGRPDATSWTTESQAYLSTVQEQDEQKRHTVAKLIEKFENPTSTRNNFFKIWARRRRSTGPVMRRKSCWKKWIKQKSSSSARTQKKLQCPDCKSFTEVWTIYCRCGRNLKYNRSPKPKPRL